MKALIQRVSSASVSVEGQQIAEIGRGVLVLLCIEQNDTREYADWLANKTASLRIFPSDAKAMDRSVESVGGEALIVSQFTLAADIRKGNRPSFSLAADPSDAEPLVEYFADVLSERLSKVETGQFGADMQVQLENDGPVTLLLHRP